MIERATIYSAILAGTVVSHGIPATQAPRMDAKKNLGVGKSHILNSHRMAMTVLPFSVEKLRRPRLNERNPPGLAELGDGPRIHVHGQYPFNQCGSSVFLSTPTALTGSKLVR